MLGIDDRDWFTWEGIARIKRACERQAQREGLDGVKAYFRAQNLWEKALDEKPTMRDRQKAAKVNTFEAAPDKFKQALKKIAEGHNDPRTLAREVLGL